MKVLESNQEQITLGYGRQTLNGNAYNHTGVDFVKKYNQLDNIVSAQKGIVVDVRRDVQGFVQGSYGNYVHISHADGYSTLYCHMAAGSVNVNKGDIVEAGTVIGRMGATGYAYGSHLHFEVRLNNKAIDPTPFINGKEIPPYVVPAPQPAPEPVIETPSDWVDYTIQVGDTLGKIADARGTSPDEIKARNSIIKDINKIQVNWTIKVPNIVESSNTINIGDVVIVNGIGYANSNGTGTQTKPRIEQRMMVVNIAEGAAVPYGCNQNVNMNGRTAYWANVRKA